jgi:hypothetical protein
MKVAGSWMLKEHACMNPVRRIWNGIIFQFLDSYVLMCTESARFSTDYLFVPYPADRLKNENYLPINMNHDRHQAR